MHILVLYQYFHSPDAPGTGRHYSFVKKWAAHHRVTVVSSKSGFTSPITSRYPAAPSGADLVSFDVPYANRMGIVQRLLAYRSFARQAVAHATTEMDRPDVVFATSTPLTVAWAGRKVARHWNVPWIFEVRDLWPDFPIEMGAVPGRWLPSRLRRLEYELYGSADHIITLSPDMERHVQAHVADPGKVVTHLNGTSFDLLDVVPPENGEALRKRHGLGDRRIVLYAGALGRANGIPVVLDAAKRLSDREDIVFVFVGAGFAQSDVDRAASEQPNIVSLPAVPKAEIFAWHKLAAVSLVTFIDKPVLATNSPSKFFDSLSSGTPVVVTNDGWTRRFVEDHRCGWSIERLDAADLAGKLRTVLDDAPALLEFGDNGAKIARQLFDRERMADQIEDVMMRLADAN